jgi:hypothetical protein
MRKKKEYYMEKWYYREFRDIAWLLVLAIISITVFFLVVMLGGLGSLSSQ